MSESSLLIKKGTVVNFDSVQRADVRTAGEKIVEIGLDLQPRNNERVVDAAGKLLFPGGIDPHVHLHLPFMGTTSCDTFRTGTIGALCGGTTSVIEMLLPNPGQDPLDAYGIWREKAQIACADYSFHFGVSGWSPRVEEQMKQIVEREGITSLKIFLAYKGALAVSDADLFSALTFAKKHNLITCAHCENAELIAALQERLLAEGKKAPHFHYDSRPPMVEAEGTLHFCTFLRETGARGYIVHLSCEEALRLAMEAQRLGADVKVETLIQYLIADRTFMERPDFEGAKFVMSPPLRDQKNQPVLWEALRSGQIATIGSDHAPFSFEQKKMGLDNFTKIPNGMATVEDRVRLLYTHGVHAGRLNLMRFVEVMSTAAARLFNLYPRKGRIAVGSDADIVVYNTGVRETLTAATQNVAVDYRNFEGWNVVGRCDLVTLRGHVQVEDGKFVGTEGIGQLLRRPV